MNILYGIISFFQKGGVYMIPIAAVGAMALIIIVERTMSLYFRYDTDSTKFMSGLHNFYITGNLKNTVDYVEQGKGSLLAEVMKKGLEDSKHGVEVVKDSLQTASLEVYPLLNKRLGFLPMLANIATLLGLLGTIMGLIQVFGMASDAPPSERQKVLGAGIAIAMNTTAFGLMIAVPCMFIYSVLQSKVNKIIDDIEQYSAKFLDWTRNKK